MSYILNFIKGIFLGAGAILPGISSGVLCVVFGLYEKLLDSVLNFFKNLKENLLFLLPIALGGLCGVILFGNIVKYFFYAYPIQSKSIFIGLILSSIPSLINQSNKRKKFKVRYILYSLVSLIIGISLVILEDKIYSESNLTNFNCLYLIFSGFIMSAGVIIPGLSSTLILMILGIYDAYIISISTLYLPFLLPLAIGLLIGSLAFMKLTRFLLDNYYAQTFFSIIGFTLGSTLMLYPGFTFDLNGLISIFCIIFGMCFAKLLPKTD